jgi:amino-acid N-acetyltransferase
MTDIAIRPARREDREAVVALMRGERLNPVGRNIMNFKVAESQGRIIGAAQMRKHGDGARELGSLIVAREWRRQGVASLLIGAWISDCADPIYMITASAHAAHYDRFGFAPCAARRAPRSIRFNFMMGRLGRIVSLLMRLPPNRLCVLRRASPSGQLAEGK